ncbi:MAG: class I SAM-dependent methyltransferase [Anaerolineales bacterium]
MTTYVDRRQSLNAPRPTFRQRLFAWITAQGEADNNRMQDSHKRRVFQDISGTVLEIGPGTGANLPYYPAGIQWIAVEPNPAMHTYLREKAGQYEIAADFRLGTAEQLDLPDSSVEAVVSTLVLCSVADLDATLQEVRRVLKPGGRFLFVEHVAAPKGTGVRRAQDLIQPLWTFVVDGCHPNRETWIALANAGFETLDFDRWQQDGPVATPMIAGVATKAARNEPHGRG